MRSRMSSIGLVAALGVAALSLPLVTALPAGAATDDAPVAQGHDWEVTRAPGGYAVQLRLDERLPVRSAAPTLFVDDELIGVATEDAAGTTLTVTTDDPRVADARDVELGWGETPAVDAVSPHDSGNRRGASAQLARPNSTVIPDDPSTPGSYTVARADYDLGDQAVPLAGSDTLRGELRGAVYYPAEKTTRSPVVLFLHGRHSSCTGNPAPDQAPWPCPDGMSSIPSYLGYTQMADALASNGYVVVSISANAINAFDNSAFDDLGANARGQLVLDSLDLLADADAGTSTVLSANLAGRLDLTDVGLMGHSRGGDGVVRAALLNARRANPYGIRSVLPLAPTDFTRQSLPGAAMATILPYCDGDLPDLQGQHYIDDSRRYGDDALRTSILMMGANHNYFNTYWTPEDYTPQTEDDWGAVDPAQTDPTCGSTTGNRLTPAEQRAAGTVWLGGFFRLTLGGEQQFLPLFDGSATTTASAGRADVRTTATLPSSSWTAIDPFTAPGATTVTNGTAEICNSLAGATPTGPYCASTLTGDQVPHWSRGLLVPTAPTSPTMHFTWTARGGDLTVPVDAAARPAAAGAALRFKIAPDQNTVGSTELSVALVDGAGHATVVNLADIGDQLQVLPGTSAPLRKILLRDVVIPTDGLPAIDTSDIVEIHFTGGTDSGGVHISDLGFGTVATGAPAVSTLPAIAMVDTRIDEGESSSTFGAAVLLSAPSADRVTADVTVVARTSALNRRGTVPVTFEPGQTCAVVRLPLAGDLSPSGRATSVYTMSITEPHAAQLGFTTARLLVHDDDAALGSGIRYGVQGDPCVEATQGPAEMTVTTPTVEQGGEIGATSAGFRVGETVQAVLIQGGTETPLETIVNDGGRPTLAGRLASDVATGSGIIEFRGAGSLRRADGAVSITAGGGGGGGSVPADDPSSTRSALAATGFEGQPWWAAALLLLLAGGAVVFVSRRRVRS